jgi:hypothetical protein
MLSGEILFSVGNYPNSEKKFPEKFLGNLTTVNQMVMFGYY